ncbi:DNA-processing protein DprA [Actinoplanes sp. NPDC020271]|uniref:DNA-processing protein DprA n=1 Tax=Actinoplanes sp. NPDC020271 TaxID=3363896 RepID=UPI00378D534B
MISERERTRTARAVLACLSMNLPASAERLHELTVFLGPVEALDKLISPSTSAQDRAVYLGAMTVEQLRTRAAAVADATRRAGARVLIPEDDDWPERLDDLSRVPYAAAPSSALCLWARGSGGTFSARTVAICGSQVASPYGNHVASDLGRGMADAGWSVAAISGYGIPAAAVRGALAADGRVVMVLSGGIDRPHPQNLNGLHTQVARTGLLVSAYPPGTTPTRDRATAAGRLLAGMASGAVLVESPLRGRAIAVTKEAIRRGRRAMVVPGPVTSALSAGTHQVLRDHPQTRLVRDTADILAEFPHLR